MTSTKRSKAHDHRRYYHFFVLVGRRRHDRCTKQSDAKFYPSEVVMLGLLFALKGAGNRTFYRWLKHDYLALLLALLKRTRLFCLFKTHTQWTMRFLAEPTVLGMVDSFNTEADTSHAAKTTVRTRLAKKASSTIAGLSSVNFALSSISGVSSVAAPPRMSTMPILTR